MSRAAWLVCLAPVLSAAVLRVGPEGVYAFPCQAVEAAQPGDVIEIDARGVYGGDSCEWNTPGLTLRGVRGRPRVGPAGGSGILWSIRGDDTVLENLELTAGRGAAVVHRGRNLTLIAVSIHHSSFGVVSEGPASGALSLERCEFGHNGEALEADAGRVTIRYSYFHDPAGGRLIASRAAENYLLYNRITSEAGWGETEVWLYGDSWVVGNVIQKGANSPSTPLVRAAGSLFLVNNTLVNDAPRGWHFVEVVGEDVPLLQNNIFHGPGRITDRHDAVARTNLVDRDPLFFDPANHDYRLRPGSPAIDAGSDPGAGFGRALVPQAQYRHPACYAVREAVNAIDIGAFESDNRGAPGEECAAP